MIRAPRAVAVVVGLAALATFPACAVGGGGTYHLTAYFPQTVAFYNQSKVKLMGINVGAVDQIQVVGDEVRVRFSVDRNVPLPADVHAAIMPLSLIGERNLTLFPPWQQGEPKITDGTVIPESRTQVPVEVDAILRSIKTLVDAINPADLNALVSQGAAALQGHGQQLNQAIQQVTALSASLADQDGELLQIAANIHQLAAVLNSRQAQLGAIIDDFAQATGELASERQALTDFLAALAQLAQQGQLLIQPVEQQLPGDIATLTSIVLTVQVNADGLASFVDSLYGVASVLSKAYDPKLHEFFLRVNLAPTAVAILAPLLQSLGISLPCLPVPPETCP